MEAKIIMPRRPEPSRQASCDWLVAYYRHRFSADAVVLTGDGGPDDEPFNKSRTVNVAVVQWPEHVCVIADADVLICDWSLRQAIQLAATHDRLYLPHNSVCRMTKLQSERFLQLPPNYRVSERLYRKQRSRAAPGGMWGIRGEFFLRYKWMSDFVAGVERIPNCSAASAASAGGWLAQSMAYPRAADETNEASPAGRTASTPFR